METEYTFRTLVPKYHTTLHLFVAHLTVLSVTPTTKQVLWEVMNADLERCGTKLSWHYFRKCPIMWLEELTKMKKTCQGSWSLVQVLNLRPPNMKQKCYPVRCGSWLCALIFLKKRLIIQSGHDLMFLLKAYKFQLNHVLIFWVYIFPAICTVVFQAVSFA